MFSPQSRPPAETGRSRGFENKKPTSKDESLTTLPLFLNVPLTEVETSLLFFKRSQFLPTPHEDREVQELFSEGRD